MNALGKFLESRIGTWCVLTVGTLCLPLLYFAPAAGALILGYIGLVIPQLNLMRQAEIAKEIKASAQDERQEVSEPL